MLVADNPLFSIREIDFVQPDPLDMRHWFIFQELAAFHAATNLPFRFVPDLESQKQQKKGGDRNIRSNERSPIEGGFKNSKPLNK